MNEQLIHATIGLAAAFCAEYFFRKKRLRWSAICLATMVLCLINYVRA